MLIITVIRCAAALLALAIVRAAAIAQIRHTIPGRLALVAYVVALCILTLVWGIGHVNHRLTARRYTR